MHLFPRRTRALATGLAALAGFVDASGFILMGGFFVSFMSGNSTRLGVSLASGSAGAVMAGTLLVTFVIGVILGSLLGGYAKSRRRPVVLSAVALLLSVAALLGAGRPLLAGVAMTLAMGCENAVLEANGEVRFGLTYMTGTLVKIGQHIAAALLGGRRFGWAPYLFLWMGLAGGGLAGALIYSTIGVESLWIAAGAAGLFAIISAWLGPDSHAPGAEGIR